MGNETWCITLISSDQEKNVFSQEKTFTLEHKHGSFTALVLAAKKLASSATNSTARERRRQAAAAVGGLSPPSKSGSFGAQVSHFRDDTKTLFDFISKSDANKHELCVLSASGTISNASLSNLHQEPELLSFRTLVSSAIDVLGSKYRFYYNQASKESYGQYEILSLIGSYIRGEHGGKTGGLSVCLSSSDGFGGGVGGPLKAAGPVQKCVDINESLSMNQGESGLIISYNGLKGFSHCKGREKREAREENSDAFCSWFSTLSNSLNVRR
ncbi:hypothetical protein YC2023_105229 [Brassica napus]